MNVLDERIIVVENFTIASKHRKISSKEKNCPATQVLYLQSTGRGKSLFMPWSALHHHLAQLDKCMQVPCLGWWWRRRWWWHLTIHM